ncbi:MAG: SH3 domain-containing protein [Caryophanon sp.]|nr:SH3 domain-containing protein [Caryophanon sp.]
MNIDILQQLHQLVASTPQLQHFEHRIQQLLDFHNDNVRILVMGEFSAGKSSLINALLERPILPTGAVATTAITTFLRYSEQDEYFEAVYGNGDITRHALTQLAVFSSERETSTVRSGLQYINVYVNAPILKNMTLIDTPGLNSLNDDHTEQAMNVYKEADDGIWIFNFGKIGTSSEMTELKKLLKLQLHPLGVINMIDLSDSDDLTDLYDLTTRKLEGTVRDVVGVSAKEALEAIEEQDDDLLDLSNILILKQQLARIQIDRSKRYMRLIPLVEEFSASFHEAIKQLLHTSSYLTLLDTLEQLHETAHNKNTNKLNTLKSRYKQLQKSQAEISKIFTSETDVSKWLRQYEQEAIEREMPVKDLESNLEFPSKLKWDIHYFNENVANYNAQFKQKTNVHLLKRILFRKSELQSLNEIYKLLTQKERTYKERLGLVYLKEQQLLESWYDYDVEVESIMQPLQDDLMTQQQIYNEEIAQQQTENERLLQDANTLINSWLPIVKAHMLIKQLDENVASTIVFVHVKRHLAMRKDISSYNEKLMEKTIVQEQYEWNHTPLLPQETIHSLHPIEGKHLSSYRIVTLLPLTATAFIGLGTVSSTVVSSLQNENSALFQLINNEDDYDEQYDDDSDYDDTDEYNYETYDADDSSHTPTARVTDSTRSVTTISPSSISSSDSLGYVTPSHDRVPVFSHPDADGTPIGYLRAGEAYDILAVSERLRMKLGEDQWIVYNKSDVSFNQQELNARLQTNATPLQQATVTSHNVAIFSQPSRSSAMIGYLENKSTVSIYDTASGDWVDIGNGAWVESDKHLSISWPYTGKNSLPNPIGEAVIKTDDFLNVRASTNVNGQVLGRLLNGERVNVYAVDNATGWLKVGSNAWISGDKKYVTYTKYVVASPTPKQTTVPQTTAPQTTSTPTPQSSAPQQNNVVQQKPPAQTSSEVTETVEAETIEIEETAPLEAIGEVTVITKEFINVRNAPNQTGDIIGTLDQYEYVEFYDVNNSSGWLQIGENEWISGDEAFVTYTFY